MTNYKNTTLTTMTYLKNNEAVVIPAGTPFFHIGKRLFPDQTTTTFHFWGYGAFPVDIRTPSIFRKLAINSHRRVEVMAIVAHSELIEGEMTTGKMRNAHIDAMLEAIDMGERKQLLPAWKILQWHKNIWPYGGMLRETHAHSTTGHIYAEPTNLYGQIEAIAKIDKRTSDVWFHIAEKHYQLAHLHPFGDGNGRIARLFTNWMAAYLGQQPIRVCCEHRHEYIGALEKVDIPRLKNLFIRSQVHWFS